jgi:hypothetical protein
MSNQDYIKMVENYQNLTIDGFGIEIEQRTKLTHEEIWDQKRQALKDAHQEFEYCCQWVSDYFDLVWRKSTYHLKHQVENRLRENHMKPDYIPQGVFILAAISMGYKIHRIPDSSGARIGEWVGIPQNLKIRTRPGKLTVIHEAAWHCPKLVAMRYA